MHCSCITRFIFLHPKLHPHIILFIAFALVGLAVLVCNASINVFAGGGGEGVAVDGDYFRTRRADPAKNAREGVGQYTKIDI